MTRTGSHGDDDGDSRASARIPRRLALVLWKGDIGGAEVVSVALADEMRKVGAEATIVFVEGPEPLARRLRQHELPYSAIGMPRGRSVLRHPSRYADEVRRAGPDGALLVACGYLGAALRLGGYRAPIVAVEHGDVLYEDWPWPLRWLARRAGAWADDIEIGVSDFISARLLEQPHAADVRRIYNGIDPDRFSGAGPSAAPGVGRCRFGFAGRLVFGKGADHLLDAVGLMEDTTGISLTIAGDGPERGALEARSAHLGLTDVVTFAGLEHDMPGFWGRCDVAVVPSAEWIEACPMTPLEAMASSRAIVATENGGLTELVLDGVTGTLVPPGDAPALAGALERYAADANLCSRHGEAGRARAQEHFRIDRCAREYLDLFDELSGRRLSRT
jgi:glycosyltransferase involved in cell wall biosynthesis